MRHAVGILGTPIDVLDTQETLARLDEFIQDGRFHQVITANTDFLVNALGDTELHDIFCQADLVIPDGMPLIWASRMLGCPLPERVAGADLVPMLTALAAKRGYRIYMVGGRPEVAALAKERLEEANPGVQIVGCVSPAPASLAEMDCEAIFEDIERTRPDILLVAFGNPKQEKWIHLHRERLQNVPVCIGVGGTFDFLAGQTHRAPEMMQRAGLEWVHRLANEPARLWRRYSRDLWHGGRSLVKQLVSMRRCAQADRTSAINVAQTGDCVVLSLTGDFNRAMLPRFASTVEDRLRLGYRIVLDLQGVSGIDAEALGALITLPKRAAQWGCDVRLLNTLPSRLAAVMRNSQMLDGLYTEGETAAEVFAWDRSAGLSWEVQCGHSAAAVVASGSAQASSVATMEEACRQLLASGRRVDLDLRNVSFVDSALLIALCRLERVQGQYVDDQPKLRLALSETIQRELQRNGVKAGFTLCERPEVPADADVPVSYPVAVCVTGKPDYSNAPFLQVWHDAAVG